jgi:hypothetical protein
MDSDLYDEFGNYTGPALQDEEEEEFDESRQNVRCGWLAMTLPMARR